MRIQLRQVTELQHDAKPDTYQLHNHLPHFLTDYTLLARHEVLRLTQDRSRSKLRQFLPEQQSALMQFVSERMQKERHKY
jgi:hypothetical protein